MTYQVTNPQPHKRSAARFAKKIADPTFDRSQVIDPRDIAVQIEEEIRAGSSAVPVKLADAVATVSKKSKKQDRSVPPKSEEQSEVRCSGLANAGVVTLADIAYVRYRKRAKQSRNVKELGKRQRRRLSDGEPMLKRLESLLERRRRDR